MEDTINDDVSLHGLYQKAYNLYIQIESGKYDNKEREEAVYECIENFEKAALLVSALRLFSPNETLEDINTPYLKFLLISYYLGAITLQIPDMDRRLQILHAAQGYFNVFLLRCEKYEIMDSDYKKYFHRTNSLPDNQRRDEKIARFKKEKALKESLRDILRRKQFRDEDSEDEETEREHSLLLLKLCIHKALDHLETIEKEIPLAEMRAKFLEENGGKEVKKEEKKERRDVKMECEINRRINMRQEVMSRVFNPGWIQPTMSVEEAGEIELRIMRETQQRQEAAEKARELEKENVDEDAETLKQREWDDW
eukprot:CAMPEP_0174254574 /NCGR_PEP_ID=MMETSP0439-20130205/3889_1 /TAXON_ID=0 /ORGANISM="Stereomyxa ramosa, Strain Chinc5" /LENGTH=310 /DNA_ID=CAMNT_0015336241 /DNA_START=44 /DNA_END=973 /DNA_ORIENTATION=+